MSFRDHGLPQHDEALPPGVSESQISGPPSDGDGDSALVRMTQEEMEFHERELDIRARALGQDDPFEAR